MKSDQGENDTYIKENSKAKAESCWYGSKERPRSNGRDLERETEIIIMTETERYREKERCSCTLAICSCSAPDEEAEGSEEEAAGDREQGTAAFFASISSFPAASILLAAINVSQCFPSLKR